MSEHRDSKEDLEGYLELTAELDEVHAKFYAQPWIIAILAKRSADDRNKAPANRGTYFVTRAQYSMIRKFSNQPFDNVRLYGYYLIPGDN